MMVLQKLEQMDGHILCTWKLTYKTDADMVRKAAVWLHEYYGMPEILQDGKELSCYAYDSGPLTVRGVPKVVDTPMVLTFEAGAQEMRMEAWTETKGYEAVTILMGQFLDSVEIAMHR